MSPVQRSEPAVCLCTSPPFWISFPFRAPQNGEWRSLCRFRHYSSVSYMVVHIVIPVSQFTPPHLSPRGVHMFFSLHLCLSYCFAETPVPFSGSYLCVLIYDFCPLLTLLCVTDSRSLYISANGTVLFLFMAKWYSKLIFLIILHIILHTVNDVFNNVVAVS